MSPLINKFRSIIFPPNSKIEQLARTVYHRFNMTRFSFVIRDWIAKRSCKRWLKSQQKSILPPIDNFSYQPKVSFIISLIDAPQADFLQTYQSINKLIGNQWELLCIVSEKESREISSLIKNDPHLKLLLSDKGNVVDQGSGDFLLFCQPGDQFSPSLLLRFYEALNPPDGQGVDLCYYDCEYFNRDANKVLPLYKPSKFSSSLLLSVNYLSRGFVRRELFTSSDFEVEPTCDLISQEYKWMLKFSDSDVVFKHVPYVLVSYNELVKPDIKENQKMVIEFLEDKGVRGVGAFSDRFGVRFYWPVDAPSVAIIIPTINNKEMLEPLIDSIIDNPYENFTISIVDNGSKNIALLEYYEEIEESRKVSIIPYTGVFNYSEAINLGVANSQSDLLLFLNDDMGVTTPFWLEELAQWASLPEIGVVGTKLIRKNHTIQHAGIILGLNNFAGHIYLNAPEHYEGLFGSVDWYRDYVAVTGACQMVRREVFEEVGGYDEKFSLAFGDIDFCLKVHEAGYANMYTPFATLFHYEGQSRGYSTPVDDIINGYERLESYLQTGDPYYSPNLTYTSIPRCNLGNPEDRHAEIERRRDYYRK